MTRASFPTPRSLAGRYGLTETEARLIIRDGLRAASRRLWPLSLGLMMLSLYALCTGLAYRGPTSLGFMATFLGLCGMQLWLTLRLAAPGIDAAARGARG